MFFFFLFIFLLFFLLLLIIITTLKQTTYIFTYKYYILTHTVTYNSLKRDSCTITVFFNLQILCIRNIKLFYIHLPLTRNK